LIQQRLEEVMILPVHQRDPRRPAKILAERQPPKSSPQNHDVRFGHNGNENSKLERKDLEHPLAD
jgi:hypothetical protein